MAISKKVGRRTRLVNLKSSRLFHTEISPKLTEKRASMKMQMQACNLCQGQLGNSIYLSKPRI